MSKLTITEALAELKTIDKRAAKKHEFIKQYLMRPRQMMDPHEKDGGSPTILIRERQSLFDLLERRVRIRTAITKANSTETITVNGKTRTIAEWLTWRRDVAPLVGKQLAELAQGIQQVRAQLRAKGVALTASGEGQGDNDVLVNINEKELSESIENHETTLGTLDGQFSLKNATIVVEVD